MCWWAVVVPLLGLVSLTCANDAGIQRRLTPQSAAAVPRPARKLAEASGPVRTLHRGTPIASRACAVGSILLYPGAIWTPEPCLVCACQTGGTAVCERTECLEVSCAGARVPPGRCCPVCPVSGEPGGSRIAGVDSADKRGGNRGRKPSGARVEGAKGWGGRGDGSAPRGEGEGRPKVDRARPPKWGRAGAKGGSWGAGGLLPILERAGLRELGVGLREGRVGVKGREAGTRKEAAVVRKEETGIKKQEAGIKKQALGIKKLALGIKKLVPGISKQALGVKKQEVGVRKVKEGARNEEARVTEQEVGTRKEELGTRKQEAGIQPGRVSKKPQADLRKSDPGLHSPEVGQKKWGSGHRKMEAGPGKEGGAGRRGTGAGVASGKPGAATRKWGTPPRGGGGRKEAGKRKPEAEPGKRPRATKAPVPFPPELLPPLESESKIPSLPSGCILAERAIACPGNKLSVIPKLADPALHTLYLADNDITTVSSADFAHLPNIQWLDLSRNNVGDEGMDSEAFRNLTRLRRLNLDGNRLGKIPWLPPSLEELKLNDNRLTAIDRNSFRGLSRLLTLDLEDNGLDDGNLNPTSFRPLRKLVYLRLGRNRFRALPSGLPASLRELYLENNLIEEIPGGLLNKTTNLTILILRNNSLQENRISPQAWFHLRNLETLDLSHNRMVHVPSFLPTGLKQLLLHHNQIERIPGYVFAHLRPGLEFLHLSYNNLRNDGIHAVSFLGLYNSLQELLLDHNQLRAIPRGILKLRVLQALRLSDNHIRHVPMDSICDTRIAEDSSLVSVHLENNLIDRRLIPPTALSCIRSYHSVILRPQRFED